MKFLRVRDLLTLSVILVMRIVSWFSWPPFKRLVVKSIAFTAYCLMRDKRRSTGENLFEAFDGKLNEKQTRRMVREIFHQFWQSKFSLLPSSSERAGIKRTDVRGIEHLQKSLKKGKGTILWESHSFGKRALSKQILHEKGFVIHQVYGETHLEGFLNPFHSVTWVEHHIIKRILERFEKKFVAEIIYLPGPGSFFFTRILLARLRQNGILCIPGEGAQGQKQIPVKFLNQTRLFSTGMISLAKLSGASILPVFCITERSGKTSLIIESPISIDRTVDRERCLEKSVCQFANLLESYVRRYPEEYRYWHRLRE